MQMKNKKGAFALLALAAVLAIALAAVPAAYASGVEDLQLKTNFGGSGDDLFYGVTATSDGGFVAVGCSTEISFGTGDWSDADKKGNTDATIVKFDSNGSMV